MNLFHHEPLAKEGVYFIVGPTCTGKTAVAQWIAEREGFDILSADSMLVYRGMNIGTAKPGVLERSRVRYWGIDLVSAVDPFNVGMYRRAALDAIKTALSGGRGIIVAGGTGLYVKSLLDGLAPGCPADASIRLKAERVLTAGGMGALQRWLQTESGDLYESLADKKNPRRLIRALELASAGAASKSAGWRRQRGGSPITGLIFPREQLGRRIERRVREMFSAGLLEETRALLSCGFESAQTARQAIGYAEAVDCIMGRCSLEEAVEKTVIRTRQFAKRQVTWFRHQADVQWVERDDSMSIADTGRVVIDKWRAIGPAGITM